jgi:hypothetical protein
MAAQEATLLLEAGADMVVWEFIRASGLAAYVL